MKSFLDLGLTKNINNILEQHGIQQPTPIQEQTIPSLLENKDVIGQAQTGTGKTLAFLLPIMETLDRTQKDLQALIVAPTRELAIQITNEAKKLSSGLGLNVLALYGGQDVDRQIRKLEGSIDIAIGTPGRILDHIRRGTLDLSRLKKLVLDEADQMLHIGFLPEVEQIIEQTPNDRQTMLFSATMPKEVRALSRRYMNNPQFIKAAAEQITASDIKQLVIETTDRGKLNDLEKVLKEYQPFLAIIFCRTKIRAKKLTESLAGRGYNCDELHGDLTQAKREKVMDQFRSAKIQYLVATDVAARGLDVEGVTLVVNYDIPHDTESYVHRIGRTGRAGGEGAAITLAAPKDHDYLRIIEKGLGFSIDRVQREKGEREEPRNKQRNRTGTKKESSRFQKSERSRKPGEEKAFQKKKSGPSRQGQERKGPGANPASKDKRKKPSGGRTKQGRPAAKGRGR